MSPNSITTRYDRHTVRCRTDCNSLMGNVVEERINAAIAGVTEIVAYSAVEELGRVLNPMIVAGQIHGGVVQGVGQALGELIVHDPDSGQMLTASFMDYQMPRADEYPDFRLATREVPTAVNPLGAKGVGEAGTVGALGAAMNAINDALAPLGIRHFDMPATPGRVWAAIQAVKE